MSLCSLLCRTFDSGLAECCHEEGVRLHAYSPLAMGLLTVRTLHSASLAHSDPLQGKYRDGGPPTARFNTYRGRFAENEYRYRSKPNIDPAIAAYASLAEESGIPLTEMALRSVQRRRISLDIFCSSRRRFVMQHPLVETAVMGATRVEQLRQNLSLMDLPPLDRDLLNRIDAIHLEYPNPAP